MSAPPDAMLMLAAAGQRVAVRLGDVVETLRPLPLTAVDGLPDPVCGLAVVRGLATPVIDLRRLLGSAAPAPAQRWVSLRLGERRVALAADAVIGVGTVDSAALARWPALLGADRGRAALGVADGELTTVLDAARLVPDAAWARIAAAMAA